MLEFRDHIGGNVDARHIADVPGQDDIEPACLGDRRDFDFHFSQNTVFQTLALLPQRDEFALQLTAPVDQALRLCPLAAGE